MKPGDAKPIEPALNKCAVVGCENPQAPWKLVCQQHLYARESIAGAVAS